MGGHGVGRVEGRSRAAVDEAEIERRRVGRAGEVLVERVDLADVGDEVIELLDPFDLALAVEALDAVAAMDAGVLAVTAAERDRSRRALDRDLVLTVNGWAPETRKPPEGGLEGMGARPGIS
ncbi:hypothetical protein GCM10007036_14390 [Alsobacter metallidurans]|uniref:Uncharacterized protein n=1 Tax=Alsobacter metallidurans TaxID=340221 RepID=A0A917I6L4_9HYPH|nr:hypothetical protein GCM10007036_14390 [Alsobacter metallidurans]